MQEESRMDYLDNQIKNSRATWYYEGLPEQIECYLHKGDYGQYQRDYFIPDKSLRAKYKDCELFYDNESDPNCSNTMATIRVRDNDLSKAYEIVKAFKEALNKSDRSEKIKTKEIDGALYIYIAPFDTYPEFRMVTPAYRKSAIEDITLSLDDFSRTFDIDLLDGLSSQEKMYKIKEETKKEFPKASKADINYVIDNIYEYLDEGILRSANSVVNRGVSRIKSIVNSKKLEEDVASSLPATPLPEQAILDYIAAVPKATSEIPPRYFKFGYMSEETYKLAAKFRGGKGSVNRETGELLPNVRVFKCAEYSRVYIEPYNLSKKTIAAFKAQGKDPQKDVLPRKGFHPSALGIRGIFESDLGKGLAFGPLIATNNITKTQYFISINDEDLRPCTKQEAAQYAPNPEAFMTGYVAPVTDTPQKARTQTFFLSKIYMIGNLGESVVKK